MLTTPTEAELIGVKTRVTRADVREMKRSALLFDQIVMLTTVGWCIDGTGVDLDVDVSDNSRNLFFLQPLLDDDVISTDNIRQLAKNAVAETDLARSVADAICQRYRCSAVAIVDGEIPTSEGRLDGTLRITLGQLPLPAIDTPWDAIWDWREDDMARRMYARLRAWISRAARNHDSTRETIDELAAQLADYDSYMALHHRNMVHSRLDVIITTTAELLESLVTFRLSAAVKQLLNLRRAEINLLKTELDAPGREVAYLYESHRRFGSR